MRKEDKATWKHLRRRALYIGLRILRSAFVLFSFKCGILIGAFLGNLSFLILKNQRKKTIANLAFAFGQEKNAKEIRSIAKGVFRNLGRNVAELLNFPKIGQWNIDNLVSAVGLAKVDRALEIGKGAIIVTSHLGNWELLAAYFSLRGYRVNVIARKLRIDGLDKMVLSLRNVKQVRTIRKTDSPRKALEVLRRNEVLGVLPDQDTDSVKGVFVDFFGHPAYTPVGPVSLALASGAPLIPCYIVRRNGTHRVIVEDPLELIDSEHKEKNLQINTLRWSKITESYIRRYPSQWVWMHDRWKTKPKDSSEERGASNE